ncbi:MAG: hypothetical protein AABY65_10950 [Nitrospirota bacterium]|jgi:hypothetical protein
MSRRALWSVFLLCVIGLLAAPMSGRAEEVPVRTYEGISYISGGATKDERETLKPNYPLKLVFAGTTGHLLSGVQVKIESKGKKVFEAAADGGPWLFVSLKPGSYNVSATYRGVTKKAGVTVGAKGTKTVLLTWKIEETVRRGK